MNWLLFVAVLTAECLVAAAKSQAFDEDILFRQKLEHALNSYLPSLQKEEHRLPRGEEEQGRQVHNSRQGHQIENSTQGRQIENSRQGHQIQNSRQGKDIQNPRQSRQIHSSDGGATMYLPLGGQGHVRCPTAADAAAVSIAQMTFLSTTLNILSIVININNNINNNNNNNNQLNINAQSNNNIVSNTNVNNGNQVNVMVPVLNP